VQIESTRFQAPVVLRQDQAPPSILAMWATYLLSDRIGVEVTIYVTRNGKREVPAAGLRTSGVQVLLEVFSFQWDLLPACFAFIDLV